MNKKRPVLIGIAVLVDVPRDDEGMYDFGGVMREVSDALEAAARQVAAGRTDCKPMDVISYHYLEEEGENAARCSYCGRWASDNDRPNPIDGIALGFTVNGRSMCDQCRVHVHKE